MPYEVLDSGGRYEVLDAPDTTTKAQRFTKGLRDPIDGGAQLLTNLLPKSIVDAGNTANNWLADKTGLVGRLPEGGVDQQVREAEAAYQAQRGENGGTLDGLRITGNVLSPTNLGMGYMAAAPKAVGLLAKTAAGAAGGVMTSSLAPVTEGDFGDEKLKQLGIGALFGGAVPAVTGGLSRVVSPNASVNPNVQLLKGEGITPTIGQALGGRWNQVEEKLTSLPILGDAISSARGRALGEFNNAAINRASGKVGAQVEGTGQAAVTEAGDALSDAYQKALSQVKVVRFDPQFAQDLTQLKSMAQSLTGPLRNKFNTKLDEVVGGRMSGTGSMLGDTYKKVDSEIGGLASKYSGSSVASEKELGDAFKQLQALLKEQMLRSNPKAAAELKAADAGWANLVRVEGAAKKAANSEGVFTPGQLNMAIREADKSTRKRAVARGDALMQDLGNAGQQVLGNKVPDSGTPGRLMLGLGSIFGGGYVDPMIPLGLLGAGAMYTRPMQGLLSGAVTARPALAQPVANALRKTSPMLVPVGAEIGLGLLK